MTKISNLWILEFTGRAKKQKDKLPESIQFALNLLRKELKEEGPERHNWPNYKKLSGKQDAYHCHLNKGNPRYVAVWIIQEKTTRTLEMRYVGTHEKADYRRIC